jgi:hypothetical protein
VLLQQQILKETTNNVAENYLKGIKAINQAGKKLCSGTTRKSLATSLRCCAPPAMANQSTTRIALVPHTQFTDQEIVCYFTTHY